MNIMEKSKKFAWTNNATEYLILLAKLGIQSKLSQVSWLNKGWTVFCPTGCPNTWIFQAAFGTRTRDILLKNVYRQAQMARVQANHIISYHIYQGKHKKYIKTILYLHSQELSAYTLADKV